MDLTESVPGAVPQSTIPKGINYTGAISWSPNDARFGYNKTYTATVVLTPDTDYAFIENSVLAQGFNISYNENTGVATLVRRYTTPKAKITSITPPGDVNLTEHSTKEQVIADLPTSVTGEDSLSGIDGIWYYIASEEKSIDGLNALEDASWVIAGEEFKVEFENDKSFICYVKIADKAGNVSKYVVKMSENATLEETAPDKDEAGDKDKPNGEDTSDKNDSSNGNNEVDGDGLDKMPQTSDNSNVVVWFGAMVLSGIVCVSVKLKKKRA